MEMEKDDIFSLRCFSSLPWVYTVVFYIFIYFFFVRLGNGEDLTCMRGCEGLVHYGYARMEGP